MVSLLDIAPVSQPVQLPGGESVDVSGVSIAGVVKLMQRFPELRMLMTGEEVSRDSWISMAPDAIAAVISAATGTPGNKDAEELAAMLPIESQMDILEVAMKVTMPHGVAPFVVRLQALFGAVAANSPATNVQPSPPSAPKARKANASTAKDQASNSALL